MEVFAPWQGARRLDQEVEVLVQQAKLPADAIEIVDGLSQSGWKSDQLA
jgi:hypothetical protein